MNERRMVRSYGGPGGIHCPCCGGSCGRKGKGTKRAIRSAVRAIRRKNKNRAINEGWNNG